MSQTDEHRHDRVHAMDAIRTCALLLGIALHAGLPFVIGLDASIWPINDTQKSVSLTIASFVIHIFRMSVFFLVAGFLARVLFHRLGAKGFVRNRAARILVPLILFWVICFVLIVAIVLWAMARANAGQLPNPMPPGALDKGLSFLHLWFLYVLLWLYAAALGLHAAKGLIDPTGKVLAAADQALRAALSSFVGPLMLAVPIAATLFLKPGWIANQGIPTPAYSLIPDTAALLIYGFVFAIGWLLERQRDMLGELARRWVWNFSCGVGATSACLALLASAQADSLALTPRATLVFAASYGIAVISLTLAFIGAGVRFLSRPSLKMRYLSDAAYWMYIAHLPVVMALQTSLMLADCSWPIKYALINASCVALLLLSYRLGVRSTWIGRLLSGKRHA